MHYTRIYQSIINHSLRSDKKLYYTLSYLKLRTIASQRAGFFSFEEAKLSLNLSSKTTSAHLKQLISERMINVAEGGYLMLDERKVSNFGTSYKSRAFIVLDNETLFSYSWKNISCFRAYFSELRNEKKVKSVAKVAYGFYVKPRGERKRVVKNEELLVLIPFYTHLKSAQINECSLATAQRYRKKQKVAVYSHSYQKLVKKGDNGYSEQREIIGKYGKVIQKNGMSMYSPPSTRVSNLKGRVNQVSDYEFLLTIQEAQNCSSQINNRSRNLTERIAT